MTHERDETTFRHDQPGTGEDVWRGWDGLHRHRAVDLRAGAALVVVAAHPDDETLGAGGLMARAAALGLTVDLVVATSGENSHPESPTVSPERLGAAREREVVEAAALLAPSARVHLLRLPDGDLAAASQELAAAVRALATPGGYLAAPWRGDGHPDHAAAGEVAATVAEAKGATLLAYPIWAWHWASPDDSRMPWSDARVLHLDESTRTRKRAAMDRHRTQVEQLSERPGDEALLAPAVLAHFDRPTELFFSTDAHPGPDEPLWASGPPMTGQWFDEFYATNGPDPWGFDDRWYERRKRAVTMASLPRERFQRALEVGCSIGVLTCELAQRCTSLLAVDVSRTAVDVARRRVADRPGVTVQLSQSVDAWPSGQFDLVVLSEVGYYRDHAGLNRMVDQAVAALNVDGVLIACHWRHPVTEYPLSGDQVHAAITADSRLAVLAHHIEEDFVLDVLVRGPAVSVARDTGLLT